MGMNAVVSRDLAEKASEVFVDGFSVDDRLPSGTWGLLTTEAFESPRGAQLLRMKLAYDYER